MFKYIIIFILTNSLNATDIKPFNKFEFGDTLSPVYDKLCAIDSIHSFKIGFSNSISKEKFCNSKYFALEQIVKSAYPRKNSKFSLISPLHVEGFENIAKYNLQIIAYGIRIKNEKFDLILKLGSLKEEDTIGNYLSSKDDTLKIDKYFVPLSLQTLTLKPTKGLSLKKQKIIYHTLMTKYGDEMIYETSTDGSKNTNRLNFMAKDKTILSFHPINGVTYDGIKYLHKIYNTKYYDYIDNNR